MNPGDFETELRRQPVRPVPGEWRREILAVVKPVISNQKSVMSEQLAVSRLRADATTGQGGEQLEERTGGRGRGRTEGAGWRGVVYARLAVIFWPHPAAWAGLAGVWLVITLLNWSAKDTTVMAARKSAPPAPDLIMAMQEQRRALARLIENNEPPPVEPPKPTEPRPRGELKTAITIV